MIASKFHFNLVCLIISAWLGSAVAWGYQLEIPAELQRAQQSRIETIAEASKAAICVFGAGGKGGGSGVVISPDGFALTNYHVVRGNGPFMKCGMPHGKLYDAVLVGIDPTGDVALIKLLGRDDFPCATTGDSDELKVGQFCFAVGNPFLLATNFEPSVSWGIVSGIHRYQYPAGSLLEYADCIQTDAAINPGNSGGPLFNSMGKLVGINGRGSFEKRGRVNVGVGYAISINQINLFMSHLRSGRLVDHATLGATVATNDRGEIRVSNILESSDAFRRGLRFDDRVVSFAGRDIRSVNQFKNILGIFPKGWRVPLRFERDGHFVDIIVRLSGVHSTQQLAELIQGSMDSPKLQPEHAPTPDPNDQDEANAKTKYDLRNAADADLYESRRGFANFYFNRLKRQQVWDAFSQHGDFTADVNSWRLTVTIDDEPARFILGTEQSGLQTETDTYLLNTNEELGNQLLPENTGGLLLAMHLWRKMLIEGPANYGDVYYLGVVPIFLPVSDATGKMRYLPSGHANTLVATYDVIETKFLFDQSTNNLAAMEVYPDVDVDPCELHFLDYQVHGDLTVPSEIRVQYGNRLPITIRIDQIEFAKEFAIGDQK